MRRFRGDFSGVPWIAVLDAQATLLGTSVGPEGNYGFPSDPKSIDQFVQLMEKTAPRLGTDQLTELRQDLEAKSKTEVVK
jgi:hypothetical protein